jgi:hypothetical protein
MEECKGNVPETKECRTIQEEQMREGELQPKPKVEHRREQHRNAESNAEEKCRRYNAKEYSARKIG